MMSETDFTEMTRRRRQLRWRELVDYERVQRVIDEGGMRSSMIKDVRSLKILA